MGQSALLALLLGFCSISWAQNPLLIEVDANCGPWNFKPGGLNKEFPYGWGDHLPPVVVKSDEQFSFKEGELIQIQYLDKRARPVAWDYDNSSDSEGETLRLVNDLKGNTGNYMPSRYIPVSEYPVFLMALIGVFTKEDGSIVGSPFKVGIHRTVQVPAGAKQIQFGINDDWFTTYPPNLGGYRILIRKLPKPNLVAPQTKGQKVDSLRGEAEIGISIHQKLGECQVGSIAPNGPAAKDGTIKVDDVILAISDKNGNWMEVEDLKTPEIRRLLHGEEGSKVKIRLIRPNEAKQGEFEVVLQREVFRKPFNP
jgi:PDZ domain